MKKLSYFFYLLLIVFASCKNGSNEKKSGNALEVKSPDGNVIVSLKLNDNKPLYTVSYKGKEVILPSKLGLQFVEGALLSENVEVVNSKDSVIDETYKVITGRLSEARNHCNELTVTLKEKAAPSRSYILKFRAYNDGAAFRYIVPAQKEITSYNLKQEKTQFHFAGNTKYWFQHLNGFASGYEKEYLQDEIGKLDKKDIIGLPMTFEMESGVAGSLVEADLEHYAGMYVQKDATNEAALSSLIAPRHGDTSFCVKSENGLQTPWRAIILADRAVDLIPSNLVKNLNPPSAIADPSWIKPGLCAWDWWSFQTIPKDAKFKKGMNNATMKYYIDFAAEFKFPYMLIDADWYGNFEDTTLPLTKTIPGFDIHELVDYAGKKNVGIILWVSCFNFRNQMDTTLATFQKWGVKGYKVDFMGSDDQQMVDFYYKAASLGAKYKLMVDFHAAYKPTGLERKWPNVMTYEAVKGEEYSKAGGEPTPIHNVTLPFTRMICGPMDYTPGGFLNVNRDGYKVYHEPPTVLGTRCHELAKYVVYESAWQMVSDWPGAYRGAQGAEFLKVVPAAWDETKGVDGKIGDNIILARRSGKDWFLGAMCGWREKVDQEIPSDFLINDEGKAGGLTGRYYVGAKFEKLIKTQTDKTLKFNWGMGAPDSLPTDFFSIRWTGKIKADKTGDYNFIGNADDGIRVWIDNKQVINEWRVQAAFDTYAKVHLEAGKEYSVKIEYFDAEYGAKFGFTWMPPLEAGAEANWVYRSKTVPLNFLKEGMEYEATIYKDAPGTFKDFKVLATETKKVTSKDELKIEMAEGGGTAVYFKALK